MPAAAKQKAAHAARPARAVAPRRGEIVAAAELPAFRAQLLGWFAGAKRDLDWRKTRDPYRVWISEIMLQQTRVAAVLPYYRRFLTRFPTMQALARARLDAVLRWWAGLGYYSRARNLHRAAKEMVARHGGEFPRRIEQALALPGIGPYTAAAVLSIAYGEPHAVLDGNVARVLSRLGAVHGELRQPKRWRELAAAANALLPQPAGAHGRESANSLGESPRGTTTPPPQRAAFFLTWRFAPGRRVLGTSVPGCAPSLNARDSAQARVPVPLETAANQLFLQTAGPGSWNQAMMELGATVCTPRAPRCAACPVSRWCRAHALGIALRLPVPRRKPGQVRVTLSAAVLLDPRGYTLLLRQKGQHGGLFSSLWHFPAIQAAKPAPERLARYLQSAFGITARLEPLPPARHTVTFRKILLRPFLVRVPRLPPPKPLAIDFSTGGARTPRLVEIEHLPISNATKKIASAALAAIG